MTELLSRPDEDIENKMIEKDLATAVGGTVFEKLAVDASEAADQPEGEVDYTFTNSVTRRPDGQTTPDEY